MPKRSGSARAVSSMAVAILLVVAACAGQSGPTSAPTPSMGQRSDAPSAAPTSAPSPILSAAATTAVEGTSAPSTAPTGGPAPTPKVTAAPRPSPTLNWDAMGFSMSMRDPVSIGANAKVTLKGPVGPTCTIKVKYPSGTNASLPKPTHPNPGWWVWTWTIPASAQAGTATVTTTCTYFGDPHTGTATFEIVNPALPDGWDIEATVPGTRAVDGLSPLRVTVTIKGTVPDGAGYGQNMSCLMQLFIGEISATSDLITDYPWSNGDAPLVLDFQFDPLGPEFIGTNTWDVRCKNMYGDPRTEQHDTGTIELT